MCTYIGKDGIEKLQGMQCFVRNWGKSKKESAT